VDGAKSGLDGLVTKAGEVQTAVGEAVTRIKEGLDALEALREELRGRLEQHGQEAADDVRALGERVSEVQEQLSTRIEEASQAVQELMSAVGTAREQWAERRDALMEAIAGLEKGSREATEKYAAEIEDILDNERIEVLVGALANEMLIGKHNEAIDALGRHFEEEVPDGFPDRLQPLGAAVAELKQLCAEHQAALHQRAEDVRGRVEKAAEALQRIAPALESAQQVG
jgi:DNA repair exonuclease SbcCD ATPase subunit